MIQVILLIEYEVQARIGTGRTLELLTKEKSVSFKRKRERFLVKAV